MQYTVEELYKKKESQIYERKSSRKDAKGTRYFENEPVADSSMDDIDMQFVAEYCIKIGYKKTAEEYIRQNKDFIVTSGREEMSGAAILLFGKDPQRFFPRARVRFIRYEGMEAKVGTEMNVIKDKVFTGRILDVVQKSLEFVGDQIKERTRLGSSGRFETTPEYPEFAWKEILINAIAHRDYSIKGTDIQVKMFDDRITVESPGVLPSIVRLNNIRLVHFSRNPKIAQFLHEYAYVQEFGEGVDRMFNEMEKAGLPSPEYRDIYFMLSATIRNSKRCGDDGSVCDNDSVDGYCSGNINFTHFTRSEKLVYGAILTNPLISRSDMINSLGVSARTIDRAVKSLKEKNVIESSGSGKSGYCILFR